MGVHDYAVADVFSYSNVGNQVTSFDVGVSAIYNYENHKFAIQAHNSDQATDISNNNTQNDLGVSVYYNGAFFNKLILPILSYNFFPREGSGQDHFYMIGGPVLLS